MSMLFKRLAIDVGASLHRRIKIRATEQNTTITEWVLQAILDRMEKENESKLKSK